MRKYRLFSLFAVGCLAMSLGAAALAQDSQQDKDKSFVKDASEGGLAEVRLGELAAKKTQNPDVKAFAQRMVHDHTMLNAKMKPIALRLGVTPAEHLSPTDDLLYAKLKLLSGDEFDKSYISAMVKDHHKDLADFQQEEAAAADPQLKRAVTNGEKVIAEHTQMADQLAQKMGVS